ncbi:hypothetical protein BpHYR1_052202 [Brachionus plicatilis]|uniref:Uncharacterized protein n=1 Tax=Brachionus plicatilis TaxID=10195 RepID=A0A3M7S452_BRAPC|nr:hypothetical protein BpHYR1_052202 [Brachionus plicatilis]
MGDWHEKDRSIFGLGDLGVNDVAMLANMPVLGFRHSSRWVDVSVTEWGKQCVHSNIIIPFIRTNFNYLNQGKKHRFYVLLIKRGQRNFELLTIDSKLVSTHKGFKVKLAQTLEKIKKEQEDFIVFGDFIQKEHSFSLEKIKKDQGDFIDKNKQVNNKTYIQVNNVTRATLFTCIIT